MERMPLVAGWVTLVAGTGLVLDPGRAARALGLEGQDTALRAVGAADLVLVPGLLRGSPRWPWMVGRAALNIGQAAYLLGVARQSSSPELVNGAAGVLLCLTAIDAAAGMSLRRANR